MMQKNPGAIVAVDLYATFEESENHFLACFQSPETIKATAPSTTTVEWTGGVPGKMAR